MLVSGSAIIGMLSAHSMLPAHSIVEHAVSMPGMMNAATRPRLAAVQMTSKDIPYTYDEYLVYRNGDESADDRPVEDEYMVWVDDALLPSGSLLGASSVAIPALMDDNLMDLPNPKDANRNGAVLLASAGGTALLVAGAAMDFAQPGMSLFYVARHLPIACWAAYLRAVAAYPVMIKAALTGVTYVMGDMIAQVVQQQQQIVQLELAPRSLRDNLLRTDFWRYVRSGLAGFLFLGPLAHFYYDFVAESLGHWPTLWKIALDQTFYLAFYNTVYYLVLGCLARRPLVEVARQYSGQFWQLLRAGWRLWPFVGVLTYTVIPRAHRVLFVDVIEIAYSAILSRLTTESQDTNLDEPSVQEVTAVEEDEPTLLQEAVQVS